MKKIFAHFKTIKDDPMRFTLWILTSIVLSLSSVWIPSILGLIIGQNIFCRLMESNPFIVFSIIFLSNSIFTSVNIVGAGSNKFAMGIRGITLVMTILYLILLSMIIPLKLLNDISLNFTTQSLLLFVALFIGIYVYGFRETQWEKSVDDAIKEEDAEVEQITQRAATANNDGGEVQL